MNTWNRSSDCLVRMGLAAVFAVSLSTSADASLDWIQATATADWGARAHHASLSHGGRLWVMGGLDASRYNDVWSSTDGADWTQATAGAGWTARFAPGFLSFAGNMWIMAGHDDAPDRTNDVWNSADGVTWTMVSAAAGWPVRYGPGFAVHGGRMWILGGLGAGSVRLGDVWYSTDGAAWTQATGAAGWSARHNHTCVAFDGRMWVMSGDPTLHDVWSSVDGAAWTQATALGAWGGREWPTSFVRDGRMWIAGGIDGGFHNDVWSSTDGITWTEDAAAAPWSGRHGLVATRFDGTVWMTGGATGAREVWYVEPRDSDEDGVANLSDNCPTTPNTGQEDGDTDGLGDACDNCLLDVNADQADSDADGLGDACDNCPNDSNAGQEDSDGDGAGDACDGCPDDPEKDDPGECGCGVPDEDADSDGTPDCYDLCLGFPDYEDCNGNAWPDGCDITGGTSYDTCPSDGVPDDCQAAIWQGFSGASFGDNGSWSTGQVPSGGTPAMLVNQTVDDNRCALDVPGMTDVCSITLRGESDGWQILDVAPGSGLRVISAFANQVGGRIKAAPLSQVIVDAPTIVQQGELDIRSTAGIAFDAALANAAGGRIDLFGGTLGAVSVSNLLGATVHGFGTIDGDTQNDGEMIGIADLQIVGDLTNHGTIMIQSGILTITGALSGSGTIIGGFGGRDGDTTGLTIRGDFLPTVSDWRQLDLTHSTLQLDGDPSGGPQYLEAMAADRGAGVTLPDATVYSIGTLRIGPAATIVKLLDSYANNGAGSRTRRMREAMYVRHLALDPGVTLDLGGLHLYYESASPDDLSAPNSGVSIIDSIGGGELARLKSRQDR